MTTGKKSEENLIRSWKSKIGLIVAVITPVIALTGAYYKLQLKQAEDKAELNYRVSAVELTASQSFAEKQDLKDMQNDLSRLREDVTEIKTLLRKR